MDITIIDSIDGRLRPTTGGMAHLQSIDDVVQAFRHAQLAGDAAAAARLFTEDAVLYPPVAPAVVRGRVAVEALLAGVHRALRILDEDYTDVGCGGTEEIGYAHWRYWIRLQPREGGVEPVTLHGRTLWVLRSGLGGWRIAIHHASVDPLVPPPTSLP
jgi:uncharacterized protein (TIGR02246 family)